MIQALLNYQAADAELKKIEKKLADSEERKKAVTAKKYLEGVEDNVNKLDDRAAELIAAYEKATDEQVKLKEQEAVLKESLDSVADQKEAAYLIKKVDELLAKIKALGAKASKILEEIQAIIKDYNTIKNTTKAAQAQYKENAAKYNELKASVKDEKESIEKKLAALEKQVDAQLMARYLKKRADKMYPIVYATKTNVCGACNMELAMSEMNKLKNGEVIECSLCGRLLYQPK